MLSSAMGKEIYWWPAISLIRPLAAGAGRFRLVLALEIERHGSEDEVLQRRLIDLVAVVNVDGAADISVETGVEQAGRVLQRSTLGECHLDDALVRLPGADDAAVRTDRRPHQLPLLDHLGVCSVYD